MLVFDKCYDVLQQVGQEAYMPIMCVSDFYFFLKVRRAGCLWCHRNF